MGVGIPGLIEKIEKLETSTFVENISRKGP
jgi:hypothetical protein